jgi:DNA-binding Lrp family transcriptional regulator
MNITGNEIVDQFAGFTAEGNIVPHLWFEHLKTDAGKTDLIAITLLSDFVYWYRPREVRDETGVFLRYEKRFKADLLQRSYKDIEKVFGFTDKQAREALKRLENKGLIKREFKDVEIEDMTLYNVMFIRLFPEEVKRISFQKGEQGCFQKGKEGSFQKGNHPISKKGNTNTEITNTEITQYNKKTSRHKYEPCDMENANLLFKLIKENNDGAKEPNVESWANEFRLMRERDGRTDKAIKYLIDWTQNDSFWKTNILSPSKLRKQYDQLVVKIKVDKEKQKNQKQGNNVTPAASLQEFDFSQLD